MSKIPGTVQRAVAGGVLECVSHFSPKINLCNSAQITKEVQPKPSLTFWFALIWSIFEGFATKDQPQGPRCLPTGQLVHMAPQKDARLKAGKGR